MIQLEHLQQFISDRGEEGWELVSVTLHHFPPEKGEGPKGYNQYTMFFKRPK
jgi:hypothetical protein